MSGIFLVSEKKLQKVLNKQLPKKTLQTLSNCPKLGQISQINLPKSFCMFSLYIMLKWTNSLKRE